DRVLGDMLLLVAGVEDRGAVVGADVVHLAVDRRRIVDLKEELKDVAERGLLRVEDDLDRLRVAAGAGLGRIGNVPARPAGARGDHAALLAHEFLASPEASAGEDRGLGVLSHSVSPLACEVLPETSLGRGGRPRRSSAVRTRPLPEASLTESSALPVKAGQPRPTLEAVKHHLKPTVNHQVDLGIKGIKGVFRRVMRDTSARSATVQSGDRGYERAHRPPDLPRFAG